MDEHLFERCESDARATRVVVPHAFALVVVSTTSPAEPHVNGTFVVETPYAVQSQRMCTGERTAVSCGFHEVHIRLRHGEHPRSHALKRADTHLVRAHPTSDPILLEQGAPDDSAVSGGHESGTEHPSILHLPCSWRGPSIRIYGQIRFTHRL
ncbi:hypothetical protein GCM10009587_08420 [Microbacterium maritypicum]